MSDNNDKRELAGFFKQLGILFWKNWILFKRNKLGTFGEIMMAFIFVFIILLLRYFVESQMYNNQNINAIPVLDGVKTSDNKTFILYYPNNDFIRDIVTNANILINNARPFFKNIGKIKIYSKHGT